MENGFDLRLAKGVPWRLAIAHGEDGLRPRISSACAASDQRRSTGRGL